MIWLLFGFSDLQCFVFKNKANTVEISIITFVTLIDAHSIHFLIIDHLLLIVVPPARIFKKNYYKKKKLKIKHCTDDTWYCLIL